jgi:hypothetical protein
MEEFIPYILILIGWHPDHPGKFELVTRKVFSSEAECKLHGNEAVEGRKIYKFEHGGAEFVFFCVPSSSADEEEQAWNQRLEDMEAERRQPDKEEN